MPYMNIIEVESALTALSASYPSICELITLPHHTIEGRTTHAVRIGSQPPDNVDIFYLTGGVHAREWGSCEILVNLATDLCEKYTANAGLGYGGKVFSAAEVKAIVEQMNIIIFACVNPDGRNFSQGGVTNAMWRKNRNPASSGGNPGLIGVDINRNQDFLWHFDTHFHHSAINSLLASNNPGDDTFHGTAPTSEPETQNIRWIFDNYNRIKWYIDVHSYSEDILYGWGVDEMQINDTAKNFTNVTFDGQRGVAGDSYSEYIPDGDLGQAIGLAHAFKDTLFEVRKKVYVAKPGFSLYATAGTNEDYSYSRHFVDASKSKVLGFTVEWGQTFQPPWDEMQEIIKDVSAGLIGFGLKALGINSYIVTDRDTFSSYELESVSHFPGSFYVIYDGFAPSTLGVPGATPTAMFKAAIGGATISSITATPSGPPALENPGAPDTIQRITFKFDVDFSDSSAFSGEQRDIILEMSFAGINDIAVIHLITQPNPYMSDGAVTWLSTDVRIFQLKPGEKANAQSGVIIGDADMNESAPITYIRAFLDELRGFGANPAPPFENIKTGQAESRLELSRKVAGKRVMNFAVAKVRYRANTADAANVRVFFRTFNTMVSDLSYTLDNNGDLKNYRRNNSGTIPLLGYNKAFGGTSTSQIVSIPYFAESRVASNMTDMAMQTDVYNMHNINHVAGQETVMYFGCWLDFNQITPQFPSALIYPNVNGPFPGTRVPVMQLVRGIHQCLVAEIRYQPGTSDPISVGATPAQSDRLAQRNLAIDESDNPGSPETHVVQHTLYVKASKIVNRESISSAGRFISQNHYDELVIHWNNLPRDTKATLYFPEWNVDDVVKIAADSHPSPYPLVKVDANTLECTVSDITYIPVPATSDQPYAGLLTLQLPQTVKTGEKFFIDVHQHSGLVVQKTIKYKKQMNKAASPASVTVSLSARKVLGGFTLTTLVKNGEDILPLMVRNLAALKYIRLAIPQGDQWLPVFDRYISQIETKVRHLGVDPAKVPASPDDPGIPDMHFPGKGHCYTGKISEVIFNCFGELEGFVLESCSEKHSFPSHEKSIGELAMRACKERYTVTVCVDESQPPKILRIIVQN